MPIIYFSNCHILFCLLSKCACDFSLSQFTAIQNIAENTVSLNLATKIWEISDFLYYPKVCFHFQGLSLFVNLPL